MRLHIDQPPCPRDRRVIRRLLVKPDSQKPPQPERIRRSPSDPALRIDSFKIPNQQQPEIDSRHQRWPPVVCGVKLRALLLGERIELSIFQQFIHSLVERMAWPLRPFIVADPQPLLPLSAPSCPHRHRDFSRLRWHSTRTSDLRKLHQLQTNKKLTFTTGCWLRRCKLRRSRMNSRSAGKSKWKSRISGPERGCEMRSCESIYSLPLDVDITLDI